MKSFRTALAAIALASTIAAPGVAQSTQSPGTAMQGMPGMRMSGGNMAATMKSCATMQTQMRPGAPMTSDMQRMMTQCSQMNSQMGNAKAAAPSSTLDR